LRKKNEVDVDMILKKPDFEFEDSRGIFKEIIRGDIWKELNFAIRYKGVNSGNHYHKKTLELFYVIEGKGKVTIENIKTGEVKVYSFKKNEIFIVEPFERHNLSYDEETTFAILLSEPYDKKSPDIFE
jgi:dTDP-4-dehydrorhamnose 3,5-epimerase-like enzyme